jgi:YHS domain-containing protein
MQQVRDPVCGMSVDPSTAAARVTHGSKEYYFCSQQCRGAFQSDPARYTGGAERHEPPYTKTEHTAAPKFGSAGSGGLENELPPEAHGRR